MVACVSSRPAKEAGSRQRIHSGALPDGWAEGAPSIAECLSGITA